MQLKNQSDNSIVYLVIDKEELKAKIEERIQFGLNISERQVSSEDEKNKVWAEFIDWNNFNEELIRQAFDNPVNFYLDEYKYKPKFSIDAFYGTPSTFQENVEENKATIKFQIRKLRWFYEKVELLKSPKNVTKPDTSRNSFNNLILVLNKFHKVAQAVRERYNSQETIAIKNEYDVQDLLYGILHIYFDDIRKEDSSPSHAGANSRLDFVLKNEKVIIEVKMTNENLTIKKLGEDLLVDIGRYKEYPDCKDLVVFIYDKGDFIRNKTGFANDLQKQSTSKLDVTVIINPV